jgi:hypothetical protein
MLFLTGLSERPEDDDGAEDDGVGKFRGETRYLIDFGRIDLFACFHN